MTIRPAQAGDYSEIYSLVQTAFATAKVSDGTEQDFVLELRRRDTYRPELELVSEKKGAFAVNPNGYTFDRHYRVPHKYILYLFCIYFVI